MAIDFSSLVTDVAGLVPSSSSILQDVAVSAAAGVVLKGLQSQVSSGALDPLGLFNHPANNPNATVGATATASAFAAMPGPAQASFLAAGGHIVAG